MRHLILALYALFFATGFTGAAALLFLSIRSGNRVVRLLLAFQLLFLAGLGLVAAYFYLANIAGAAGPSRGLDPRLAFGFAMASGAVNLSLYALAARMMRALLPPGSGLVARAAEILAWIVVAETLVAVGARVAAALGPGGPAAELGVVGGREWSFATYLLTGLAIASFGFVLLRSAEAGPNLPYRFLYRGYGFCALAFAPLGFAEYALNAAGVETPRPLSLDFLFYLGWNIVSMTAFSRSLRRPAAEAPLLEAVPEELARVLGLTIREREMAVLIARGLANKEIAGELGISPATVRTHIYNLFQKVGARSRIELLNRLRGF